MHFENSVSQREKQILYRIPLPSIYHLSVGPEKNSEKRRRGRNQVEVIISIENNQTSKIKPQ